MTIDMHAHWFPEALIDALRRRTSRPMVFSGDEGREFQQAFFRSPVRPEKIADRLADMDRQGVAHAVISVPATNMLEVMPADESLPLCRLVNDALSELCETHPGRFSALASLPTADVALALAEFERVMQRPGVVGALLPSAGFMSQRSAERFRPLLAAADRYAAVMLVHYGRLPDDPAAPAIDVSDHAHERLGTLDMQACLSQNMVTFCLTDFLSAFPKATVMSHNLGGNIPFEVQRMDHRHQIARAPGPLPSTVFASAPVIVDCNSMGATAMEMAVALYGADKVVFGSDGTDFGMTHTLGEIERMRVDEAVKEAIRRGNAAAVLAKVHASVAVGTPVLAAGRLAT